MASGLRWLAEVSSGAGIGVVMNTQANPHSQRAKAESRLSSQDHEQGEPGGHSMKMGSYPRFWVMVAASTALGWGAMYLNTYQLDHVFFSWTRVFMAMIMGGLMTAVMMGLMWNMYPDKQMNRTVLGVAAVLFIAGLGLVRSQVTVNDIAYMRAMIPHHSIAVLTSSRARIEDPRVRELADEIIDAQVQEIAEMKMLIQDIERDGPRGSTHLPARAAGTAPKM